jgi:nucleotide-binding universal stress UspA family protein
MYKHILIATDGSSLAQNAVATGVALAHALGACITVLMVTEPPTNLVPGTMIGATSEDEHDSQLYPDVAAALGAARDQAVARGLACTTVHVLYKFPAETVLEVAQARGCDLIVMASHGRRGFARLVLGGEALRVLTQTRLPVLVCR